MILDSGFYGFIQPSRLWLLAVVPLLVAAYVLVVRRKSKQGMRYTDTTILGEVLPKQSQWLRHVVVGLAVLSFIALAAAWARPQGLERVPRERATVVIVLDISMSMTATDVAPSRLEAAKAAAIDFVNKLPEGFNVSLVSLSGVPMTMLPPVTDHAAVIQLIQALQPQESSAIGDALQAGLAAIGQAPAAADGSSAPALIALLSDGGNTNGQAPLVVADQAKAQGVPVYTIAFGTDNGYVDIDGTRYNVAPDIDLMRQIADITGGQAYSADNVSQLNSAYTRIHSQVGYENSKAEVTASAAGLSLVFAFVAACGALMLGVRFK